MHNLLYPDPPLPLPTPFLAVSMPSLGCSLLILHVCIPSSRAVSDRSRPRADSRLASANDLDLGRITSECDLSSPYRSRGLIPGKLAASWINSIAMATQFQPESLLPSPHQSLIVHGGNGSQQYSTVLGISTRLQIRK